MNMFSGLGFYVVPQGIGKQRLAVIERNIEKHNGKVVVTLIVK